MPKPMIGSGQKTQAETLLSAVRKEENKQEMQQMDKMKLDRLLRKPRSKAYMDAMQKLDAGGHVHNQKQLEDLMNVIRNEFPEVAISGILLGIVSKCYLGVPYEVHTIDLTGGIIEHYQRGHALPGQLEKARSIAMNSNYQLIEVYGDCLRAISAGGQVSVIPC